METAASSCCNVTLILGIFSGLLRAVEYSCTGFRLVCCLENYICFISLPVRKILQKHLLFVQRVHFMPDTRTAAVALCRGRCRLAVRYGCRGLIRDETCYFLCSRTCFLRSIISYWCGGSYCIASDGPSNDWMAPYIALPIVCHHRAGNQLQSTPDIAPLFVHRNLWQYRRWR